MFISEALQIRIDDIISKRLGYSTNSYDVYNWLQNFEAEDVPMALNVLEKTEFFSVARLVQIYNEGIQQIFKRFQHKNVIFLGVGEFGKSGAAMSYFLKQTPAFKDRRYKRKLHLAATPSDLLTIVVKNSIALDDFLIVLVDDFVGSGRSTVEFLKGTSKVLGFTPFLADYNLQPELALLSAIILNEGKSHIKKEFPAVEVTAELREKVFSPHGSVFGYRPKMIPIREFCHKYGIRLGKADNALGFENSQALIVFSHTTPNNTLPIIWSSNKYWQPLFPRFGQDKIDLTKKFRTASNYWLSIARKLQIKAFDFQKVVPYNEENIQLVTIMRLKGMRRAVPLICQHMGLTLAEYQAIIDEGIKRELFMKNGELSNYGKDVYEEIRKKIAIQQSNQSQRFVSLAETVYLPVTFRGKR